MVDIVLLPMGLQTPSAPSVLSQTPPLGTLCSVTWLSLFYDPVVLGVSENLGVRLSLDVVGVGAEPAPQVCSRCRFKPEGIGVTHQVGVPTSLDPGVPVIPGFGASPPVILAC